MPLPKRNCIFCGSQCGKITKEDVWPTWLEKFIPRDMKNYTASSTVVYPTHSDVVRKKIDGDPGSRRVRRVCQSCNNGWMSRLQERAKPHVLPLILGAATAIQPTSLETIAGWCAMSVMTSDNFYPERQAIPQEDRNWLMAHGLPPPDTWKIWIGQYERGNWPAYWAKNARAISSDGHPVFYLENGLPIPNTQSSTLVFGKLFVHAFSSVHADIVANTPNPHGKLIQLFPLSGLPLRWPPPTMLDRDADDAAGKIFNALAIAAGEQ